MLSLNSGQKIAMINDDNKKFVYIKEADKYAKPEVGTTEAKKFEIFKDYLERDKKLRRTDIDALIIAYKNNSTINQKLERKLEDAKEFITNSLKHYLDFGKTATLKPYFDKQYLLSKQKDKTTEPSYRMFVSGLSGSGKSYYISEWLKTNKPKHIFIMSPVKDDPAFMKLKPEPMQIDLLTYEQEFEKPFEIEDIPADSVVIMDDIDTDKNSKLYLEVKIQLLERGRHLGISTIVVSHEALAGNTRHAKAQLRECEWFIIFPKSNKAHAEKLLKSYVMLTKDKSDLVLNMDSRAVTIKKSFPSYAIGEHTVMTLN